MGQGTNLTNPRRISPAKARLRETPRSLVNGRHPKSNWKQPKKWPPKASKTKTDLPTSARIQGTETTRVKAAQFKTSSAKENPSKNS